MQKYPRILLLFCFFAHSSFPRAYQLTARKATVGFFSTFNTVLGALYFYDESSECDGLIVDFKESGVFYDQDCGPNWWEYYFEPIRLGILDEIQRQFSEDDKIELSLFAQFEISGAQGNELIRKYIHLKSHVQQKIDAFVTAHFKNSKIIGIHYRGTDKKIEASCVPYETVSAMLQSEIEDDDVIFFVATDDALFLEHMHKEFSGRVCAIDAIRSTDGKPIHYPPSKHMYKKGEDALLDCILLSKCTKLYKMASNLSDTSMKFNPTVPVVHLNELSGRFLAFRRGIEERENALLYKKKT